MKLIRDAMPRPRHRHSLTAAMVEDADPVVAMEARPGLLAALAVVAAVANLLEKTLAVKNPVAEVSHQTMMKTIIVATPHRRAANAAPVAAPRAAMIPEMEETMMIVITPLTEAAGVTAFHTAIVTLVALRCSSASGTAPSSPAKRPTR